MSRPPPSHPSGWLCRLLHTATPPSDVAGFEHLHKGVLELLPSELRSLDEMQGSWDKDTHWFLRSIRNAGGLPRLLEIWRERGEAPQMVCACSHPV